MASKGDPNDPRGLVREAYRIENIGDAECRSIFMDWVLGLPLGDDAVARVGALLQQYGADHPDHPMTAVLREGVTRIAAPRARKGGRRRS